MDFLDYQDENLFNKKEQKPFLPDLHLKSALTPDLITELGDLITGVINSPIDQDLNKYYNSLLTMIKEISYRRQVDLNIVYGLRSVNYITRLWSPTIDPFDDKINSILINNYNIFRNYLRIGSLQTEEIVNNLLNRDTPDEEIKKLICGQKQETLRTLIKEGKEYFEIYQKTLQEKIESTTSHSFRIKMAHCVEVTNNKNLYTLFKKVDRLNLLRNKMLKLQMKRKHLFSYFSVFTENDSVFSDQFCCIFLEGGLCVLLSYDQLLLIVDTVSSRFLTLLFILLHPKDQSVNLPSKDLLQDFYKWGDDIINKYGNEGYNVVKQIEPICIAVYLRNWDKLYDANKFLNHLIDKAEEEYKEELIKLVSILNNCKNPNQLFELFGLYRHMGHPFVDETLGCKKMKEVTREIIEIDWDDLTNCLGACKKHFIINYIKVNKNWPKVRDEETHDRLLDTLGNKEDKDSLDSFSDFIKQRLLNINEYEVSYPLSYWSCIKFAKTFDYNDFEDFTVLLSDTAISPTRDCWGSLYNPKRLKVKMKRNWDYSRRTLINILRREKFSMEEIRYLIEKWSLPLLWKIICLHSKERELKIAARLFAMMVLEMRMYFAGTEKNISDTIFKYVPNQTMTNSEAELNNKLLNLTNLKMRKDRIAITFSLDMDKFNNRWRYDSTKPFFEMIDELFGTNSLYQNTHRFFEECYYCLASYNHVPEYLKKDPEFRLDKLSIQEQIKINSELGKLQRKNFEKESDTTWKGQGGGCEGLRQKGWTFIITSALSATEEITHVKSYIIGQGDNQVIVVLFPKLVEDVSDEEYIVNNFEILSKQIEDYKEVLEKNINGLGMKLKLEETWVSTSLMNYGKEILVNGCYLSSSLKRISRAYSDVNEVYPTLSTRISSIFSSCHSTSAKSFDQVIPYTIGSTLCLYTFDQEVRGKGISNFDLNNVSDMKQKVSLITNPLLTDEEARIFLGLNKEIGGYPVMPFTEYLFRGHPDPINTYFTNLIKGSKTIKEFKKIQIYICTSYQNQKDQVNYQKLIQDPVSLNWKTASMDTGEITKVLESNIRKIVVNREINKLLNHSDVKENKEVIDYLSTTTPFIPRVLNEIFRHSPEGAKLHYLSIISDMKTMKEMMSAKDAKTLIRFIEQSENKILKYVVKLIEIIKRIRIEDHMTEIDQWINSFYTSEVITNYQWERKVEGSRIPHPGQQFELCPISKEGCWMCELDIEGFKEHIEYILDNTKEHLVHKNERESDYRKFNRGPFQPYTGSSTKEKRSKSLINFPRSDKALQASQNLFRIQDWVISQNSSLQTFIINLIKSRTEIPLEIIRMASGKYYGGSVIHRFQDVVTKHACRPNSRPNIFSHVYMSSDKMGEYSGGKDNFYIHFQSVFLYGLSLINLIDFWEEMRPINAFHLHVINYNALKPIEESLITTPITIPPKVKSLKGSKLLFSSFSEYVDKCSSLEIDNNRLIDPKCQTEKLKEMIGPSFGIIIYAYMLDQSMPLIQGTSTCDIGETIHCPITLNDIKTFGLTPIFQDVGVYWFMDNIREILTFSHESQVSIEEAAELLVKRISPSLFNFIRPLMCSGEVINSFLSQGWLPRSSQYPMNGQSLEKIYQQIMLSGIHKFLKSQKPFNILIPYKSLSINRLILIYFYSLILFSNFKNIVSRLKYIDIITRQFYKLMNQEELRMTELLNYYLLLSVKDNRLIVPSFDQQVSVSVCGPESWIKEYKGHLNQLSKIMVTNLTRDKNHLRLKTKTAVAEVKDILNLIPKRYNKTIIAATDLTSRQRVPNENMNDLIGNEIKGRWTHINRLSGLYSTAHYKYSELFCLIPVEKFQVSINLAEGAGGVAKICSQWFDCSKVVYNSLLDLKDFVSQRAVDYIPPELRYLKNNTNIQILGVIESIRTGGNLLNDQVIDIYSRLIKNEVAFPSIMTMDAEISGIMTETSITKLITNTCLLFNLLPVGSYLIIKTFYWYRYCFNKNCTYIFKNFNNLKIIKPFFSSIENTEVFLLVKKVREFKLINYSDSCLNLTLPDAIPRLTLIESKDELLPLDNHQKLTLHSKYIKLGFTSNLEHSINCFLDDIIDYSKFLADPLHEISSKIDTLTHYIRFKLERSGRDLRQKRVSKFYTMVKNKNLSESLDLKRISYIFINLYILKDLLVSKKLNLSWLDEKIVIKSVTTKDKLYVINIVKEEWYKLYKRYLNRIVGHLDLGIVIPH
ncbi:MAG: RNA-dependent RNA polymerase [Hangzhou scotinophara lurida lispivirus 1]|uniref:RNA-directed RNA polymerase L n=1 Tax=Hangzhou scotinophara lurida lispivirus 1 TaxID=2905569 RepID=A0A8K1XB67_9MONO|nr:MAG: RNA-dependent RNA polymerase [Hangzhou scotinophara lurida lispivirus 1]UHK03262.1 MAG: RNA-dependent RNA polymerase [Hangzhou scotinophara lurida lispivirus 1]